MTKKTILTAVCLLLITAFICGCTKNGGKTDNTPSKTEVSYSTTFENMPKMTYDSVTTYVSGDVAFFEFINPGLDSFSAEIVSYSLSQDKVLGQVNLGEGIFQISLLEKGFAVADVTKNIVSYYDISCSKTDSVTVFQNNMLTFTKLSADGKYILAQNYESDLLIYNSKIQKVSTLNKGKNFEKAEYYKGKFYLLGAGVGVVEPENNHYYSISDVVCTYGTSLLRNHALRGVFEEMSSKGFPNEVVEAIRDSVDCNLYFFEEKVTVSAMYSVLIAAILVLIGLYVIINILVAKGKKRKVKKSIL